MHDKKDVGMNVGREGQGIGRGNGSVRYEKTEEI
jgi:hypothetical protein